MQLHEVRPPGNLLDLIEHEQRTARPCFASPFACSSPSGSQPGRLPACGVVGRFVRGGEVESVHHLPDEGGLARLAWTREDLDPTAILLQPTEDSWEHRSSVTLFALHGHTLLKILSKFTHFLRSASQSEIILRVKVFVSSVVTGMDEFREAAVRGATVLGHEVRRSEDFAASAASPQRACLEGVRWADAVLLLLGERYGATQTSGLSATHEEYREAKERRPLLAFVQAGIKPEPKQGTFIEDVRSWESGRITSSFTTPDDLQGAVTRALHELELSMSAGGADEGEMLQRAQDLLPQRMGYSSPTLALVVVGGPRQPVLRPSELEDRSLERDLLREALLGDRSVFVTEEGTRSRVEGNALIVEQQSASVRVDDLGSVVITQPARAEDRRSSGIADLIEEDLRDRILRSLGLAAWILDRVDNLHRLSSVLPVMALNNAGYMPWRTQEEHDRSPNSATMSMRSRDEVVMLSPATRPRPALVHQRDDVADDFVALLRRRFRT